MEQSSGLSGENGTEGKEQVDNNRNLSIDQKEEDNNRNLSIGQKGEIDNNRNYSIGQKEESNKISFSRGHKNEVDNSRSYSTGHQETEEINLSDLRAENSSLAGNYRLEALDVELKVPSYELPLNK